MVQRIAPLTDSDKLSQVPNLQKATPMAEDWAYKHWEGDFQYKLDYKDFHYDGTTEFLKLKGLTGRKYDHVYVQGHIKFTPAIGNWYYSGSGTVDYNITRMSLAGLGEARVVYFTDGKGKDKIQRIKKATYLKLNRAARTYSLRITPGSSDTDLDAFGVKVRSSNEMKVARAFINKMESQNRPVLFPDYIKSLFPEYEWNLDRDNIVLEAFDIPLPAKGNILKGTYTDENGGVLTWDFIGY